jgi:thiol-disulfide isomerase/thioredoxin
MKKSTILAIVMTIVMLPLASLARQDTIQPAVEWDSARLARIKEVKIEYLNLSPGEVQQAIRQIREGRRVDVGNLREGTPALQAGSPSPAFAFEDVEGNVVRSEDLKGKYLLVDVWATWCGPCKEEIPHLEALGERFRDKEITFLSLSVDGERGREAWKAMVRERAMGGVQLLVPGETNDPFIQAYGINAIPRFILLDKEGKVMDPNLRFRPSGRDLPLILDTLLSGNIADETVIDYLKRGFPKRELKGTPAPAFTGKDIDGNDVSLSDFRGKYVLIDIWATWCGFCIPEIPHLKALEERLHGRPIALVSISTDKDKAAWEKMVRDQHLPGIQLHAGDDRAFSRAFDINGIPRFILLDREGNYLDPNMATRPSNPALYPLLEALEGL